MTTHKVSIEFYVLTRKTIRAEVPDLLDGDEKPIVNCDYTTWQHITRRIHSDRPWIRDIRNAMAEEAFTANGFVDWDDDDGITITTLSEPTVLP